MSQSIPAPAISPLGQRLIDDMNMRRFSRETQRNYIRDAGRFATFSGRSPDTSTADDLLRFQIEQRATGVPTPTMNSIVSALRFFFTHTLDRPDLARRLIRVAHPRNLPVVLSRDEVARLLNATTCLKHQAALSVAYGAGLRVAEVAALKVGDVDSERMLIRVELGKGGRYRNAMLPADLLTLLREWWKVGHQLGVMHRDGWLFPGQHAMKPISTRQLHRIVVEAAQAAEITKRVGPHTLRHSFAAIAGFLPRHGRNISRSTTRASPRMPASTACTCCVPTAGFHAVCCARVPGTLAGGGDLQVSKVHSRNQADFPSVRRGDRRAAVLLVLRAVAAQGTRRAADRRRRHYGMGR